MSGEYLPYCDDLDYISRGKKGDCIPRERDGAPNVPESPNGIVTEINADPIKTN